MRLRDVRAIMFCVATTAAIAAATIVLLRDWTLVALLTAAWLALILTRPRMVRVLRRLGGQTVEVDSYYRD